MHLTDLINSIDYTITNSVIIDIIKSKKFSKNTLLYEDEDGDDSDEYCKHSLLMDLCHIVRYDVFKLLIENYTITKKDIMFHDEDGTTIFMMACKYNNLRLVRTLVELYDITKNDVLNRDNNGCNTLYIVCYKNHVSMLQFLLDTFDITKEDVLFEIYNYHSPFFTACASGSLHVVKLLTTKFNFNKEDILHKDTTGESVLFNYGEINTHYGVIYYLVSMYDISREEFELCCGVSIDTNQMYKYDGDLKEIFDKIDNNKTNIM